MSILLAINTAGLIAKSTVELVKINIKSINKKYV